ncbi:hypothetical protein [Arthrobacter sp. P2b]|uniref:hypothetical protein n=1 Tax=Arthrobacter sp. P2b TaxID=1938741 RepID=UPI0009CDF8C9|nr:hypothetical protein [Arthrobacter sp. P2b]SLK00847.1 hypothetical protein SAMN06272721_103181 [Arthrobacter sp. P2b]
MPPPKVGFLCESEGQGVITGAAATPIANSLTEKYVVQRYLRPDLLQATGIEGLNTCPPTEQAEKALAAPSNTSTH